MDREVVQLQSHDADPLNDTWGIQWCAQKGSILSF